MGAKHQSVLMMYNYNEKLLELAMLKHAEFLQVKTRIQIDRHSHVEFSTGKLKYIIIVTISIRKSMIIVLRVDYNIIIIPRDVARAREDLRLYNSKAETLKRIYIMVCNCCLPQDVICINTNPTGTRFFISFARDVISCSSNADSPQIGLL